MVMQILKLLVISCLSFSLLAMDEIERPDVHDLEFTVKIFAKPIKMKCQALSVMNENEGKENFIGLSLCSSEGSDEYHGFLLWQENFIAPFFPLIFRSGSTSARLDLSLEITRHDKGLPKVGDQFTFARQDYNLEFQVDKFFLQLNLAGMIAYLQGKFQGDIDLLKKSILSVRDCIDINYLENAKINFKDRDADQQLNCWGEFICSRMILAHRSTNMWRQEPGDEVAKLLASMRDIGDGAFVSEAKASELLRESEELNIDWTANSRTITNCFARAHVVCDWLKKGGYKTGKIWLMGSFSLVPWTYHVATIVFLNEKEFVVLDHFYSPQKCLTVATWLKLQVKNHETTQFVEYPLPANGKLFHNNLYCCSSSRAFHPFNIYLNINDEENLQLAIENSRDLETNLEVEGFLKSGAGPNPAVEPVVTNKN